MNAERVVRPDLPGAARALTEAVVDAGRSVLAESERFSLVVSGGSTPEPFLRALAAERRASLAWERVHLFWADERAVAPDDPRSNVGFVERILFPSLPIPRAHVHAIEGAVRPPERAAERYEADLRSFFATPSGLPDTAFDFVVLGVGPDGHTASLFPPPFPAPAPQAWVAATAPAPLEPRVPRITLGPRILDRSREVAFLAAGPEKREVVARVFAAYRDEADPPPAARVRPRGRLRWFLDESAAGPSGTG